MADESMELEEGELPVTSPVHGPSPSSSAAHVPFRVQLHEAVTELRRQGQTNLARLAAALVEVANLRDAMWILNDGVRGGDFSGDPALFDAFRHWTNGQIRILRETGYDDDVVSDGVPSIVVSAAQLAAAGLLLRLVGDDDDGITDQPYRNGGFGAVPASAAAVRCLLEKQTFVVRAAAAAGGNDDEDDGMTECSICFEEFVDGGQVTVMPCPSSRVHKFHPDCIAKWLGMSNMCPLCRHELPAASYGAEKCARSVRR